MSALYALPSWLVLLVGVVVAVGLACGGQLLVHRFVADANFLDDNDLNGYISGTIVTLFAVLIGFVTVVVWQQYDAMRDRVAAEASDVAGVWHDAVGLDPRARSAVRRDMLGYVKLMIGEEWPEMRSGSSSPKGAAYIMDATTDVGGMDAKTNKESNAQVAILQLLNGRARATRSAARGEPVAGRLGLHVGDHAVRLGRRRRVLLHVRRVAPRRRTWS